MLPLSWNLASHELLLVEGEPLQCCTVKNGFVLGFGQVHVRLDVAPKLKIAQRKGIVRPHDNAVRPLQIENVLHQERIVCDAVHPETFQVIAGIVGVVDCHQIGPAPPTVLYPSQRGEKSARGMAEHDAQFWIAVKNPGKYHGTRRP